MKKLTLKPSIPLKPIDRINVRRSLKELESLTKEYPDLRKFESVKEFQKAKRRFLKARKDLYILRRQAVRAQNRADKAAGVGWWAPKDNIEIFIIPQAIIYE